MLQTKAGYTLLEILVVLVIISIVAGMAVLTIGHNDSRELQTFTRELTQTLTLAEEQALLQPATFGLTFTARSFQFYELHQAQTRPEWEPLADREFGLHEIPSDIQISLRVNDKTLELGTATPGPNKLKAAPALLISTNGTLTPFTLLIGKKNKTPRYELIGHADGTVTSQAYSG